MNNEIIQYSCEVCGNIQSTNLKCHCCGNEVLRERMKHEEASEIKDNKEIKEKKQKHVVIIGGGIASVSVIRQLVKTTQYRITFISNEKRLPYYRTSIPKIITNETYMTKPQFTIENESFYQSHGIELMLNTEVRSIDPTKKTVHCHRCEHDFVVSYDDLVLATGGHPNKPAFVTDSVNDKMIPIHTVDDMERILHQFNHHTINHVVIIGAGLCGIEIAAELRRKYANVQLTMIEVTNRILPKQLTVEASEVFSSILQNNHINLFTDTLVKTITKTRNNQLEIVTNSTTLTCDFICYSCGISSNTTLASQCGCACNRGIIVDDQMKTSIPSIYACGDCCEHNDQCYGNWSDAMKQGIVCANTIAEKEDQYVHVQMPYFVHCFIGVYSLGQMTSTFIIHKSERRFIQLFFSDSTKSKLVGGILIGIIIPLIQRDLMKAITEEYTGDSLEQFLSSCSSLFEK